MPKRATVLLPIAITIGTSLAARAVFLVRRPLWFDEIFTLWISRQPASEVVRHLRLDSGPPLFYWFEHPLVRLGELLGTDLPARALSFLAIAAIFLACRRPGTSGGGRFPVLLAASPLLFFYSAEARPYALLAALGFLLFVGDVRLRRPGARLLVAGVAAALLPWVHYLGGLVVVGSILLCVTRRRWSLVAVEVCALLPFLLWLPVALGQPAEGMAWSEETWRTVISHSLGWFGAWSQPSPYFTAFPTPLPWIGVVVGAGMILGALSVARRDRSVRDALMFSLFPLAIAAVLGVERSIYFAGRTEMAVLPVALWSMARAARRSTVMRALTTASIALGAVTMIASLLQIPPPPPYSQTASFLRRNAGSNDLVVAADADYLPLRLSVERGRLRASLLGIPSELEEHPGWFVPGKIVDPEKEARRVEGFLGSGSARGRSYLAVPPDPGPRGLVAPRLAGRRFAVAHPPGGDPVAVIDRTTR